MTKNDRAAADRADEGLPAVALPSGAASDVPPLAGRRPLAGLEQPGRRYGHGSDPAGAEAGAALPVHERIDEGADVGLHLVGGGLVDVAVGDGLVDPLSGGVGDGRTELTGDARGDSATAPRLTAFWDGGSLSRVLPASGSLSMAFCRCGSFGSKFSIGISITHCTITDLYNMSEYY